jgi:site-specific DNA-methyltransferase (adenine-specific)
MRMIAISARLGDCLDPVAGLASLGDKSVDHVIMDPPYEKEAHSKVCRANTKGPGHGKSAIVEVQHKFPAITASQREEVARQCARISRGWVLAFCQIEAVGLWRDALVAGGASWRRGCIWTKPDAMPQITGDRPGQWGECMALAWAGKGRSRWNNRGKKGQWDVKKYEKNRTNPTQKPLALMRLLIEAFTQPGDLICDPFMGAGTTLVAAKELGRRAIGWEINPADYAATCVRLGMMTAPVAVPA